MVKNGHAKRLILKNWKHLFHTWGEGMSQGNGWSALFGIITISHERLIALLILSSFAMKERPCLQPRFIYLVVRPIFIWGRNWHD